MACIAKLLEQLLLTRLAPFLMPHLGAEQLGGVYGADAAAMFLWEVIQMRMAGRCPDSTPSTTWVAFVDIRSFFDRVWRAGLLWLLWHADVRGPIYALLASYLEVTFAAVLIQGRLSTPWPSSMGIIQGSVLSMLLATLHLAGLHLAIRAANAGVRWYSVTKVAQLTHSRWYVDDGALLAESAHGLQRMIDSACAWARLWRVEFRIGLDKTAVMCTRGLAHCKRSPVYMSMADGSRVALPVVNVYKYLGPPLRYDLRPADLVKELLCIGHAGVKSVLSYVNRHDASVSSAAWMWGTFVDSALKARAAFVPMTTEAMAPLRRAQLAWGRAILGWMKLHQPTRSWAASGGSPGRS